MNIRNEKILIVDDAKFMRIAIRKLFEKLGFDSIFEAESVEEALNLYRLHKPDFVTMDITMPGDSGLDGLQMIKKINPAAKILMISAVSSKANIIKAFSSGAVYFLAKPFTTEAFISIVSKIFGLDSNSCIEKNDTEINRANKTTLILSMREDNIEIIIDECSVIGRCNNCANDEEKNKNIEKCNLSAEKKSFIPCKYITIAENQAKIFSENGEFFITAASGSKFITRLNNAPIAAERKYYLMQGDVLSFGTTDFTIDILKNH